MSEYNIYKGAIEAMENCSKSYNVKFEIRCSGRIWTIKVMQKRFNNKDFLIACKDAISFVYNAHINQQPTTNEQ